MFILGKQQNAMCPPPIPCYWKSWYGIKTIGKGHRRQKKCKNRKKYQYIQTKPKDDESNTNTNAAISIKRILTKPNPTHESLQFVTFKIRQSIYNLQEKQLTRLHRTFNGFLNSRAGRQVYQTLNALGFEHFISPTVVTFRLRL